MRLTATDAFHQGFLSLRSAGPVLGAAFVFGGSVLIGIEEELLFRGLLQRRLLRAWHPAVALLVTALFFDLGHVLPARRSVCWASACGWGTSPGARTPSCPASFVMPA